MYEVWGEGSTWEEMQEAVRAYPEELKAPWLTPDLSFKVQHTRVPAWCHCCCA